jgi:hypothetical protein
VSAARRPLENAIACSSGLGLLHFVGFSSHAARAGKESPKTTDQLRTILLARLEELSVTNSDNAERAFRE